MLVDTANRATEHPGYPALLADTIGAGDGFTAMMVLGYLHGASPEEISESSNRVYAWVASQVGTTPSKERFPNTSPRRNGSKENEPTSRKR
jgi:fructokinase